ncbi:MAG: hypothetical protein GWP05_01945 [Anaerolineaceae bacterium]|nr:hypothetical protein [Anaerolineaceae bacterium]
MAQQYHIESGRRTCKHCGREFQVREEYVSALYEVEAGPEHPHGLARLDFCLDHWPGERIEGLAFWRTRVPEPEEPRKKRIVIDDDRLLEVFFRLSDTEDPARLDFRYVIGLMLIRKRRLKMEGTRRRGGAAYMLVRKSRSKQIFELMDRQLDDQGVLAVSREIGTLLDLVENEEEAQPDES